MGPMLEAVKTHDYHSSMYNVYFLVRRFFSGIILVIFHAHPYFQVSFLMVFSTINFVYLSTVKPMESKKENYIEIFNEFGILMCAYVMNIFLQRSAPPSFMALMGWTFMGISMFNILINVALAVGYMIFEFVSSMYKRKKTKEYNRMIQTRIDNLTEILKQNPSNLSYIKIEICVNEGLKKIKAWWPHYIWLKKNGINY